MMTCSCSVWRLAILLLLMIVTKGAEAEICNPQNNMCYAFIAKQDVDWNQAQDYCSKNFASGSLASIHNNFESALILAEIHFYSQSVSVNEPWIGGKREDGNSSFSWSDGTQFQFTNWETSSPTPYERRCVKYCHASTSTNCQPLQWITAPCDTQSSFVCKYRVSSTPSPPNPNSQVMEDCYDWLHVAKQTKSGFYMIQPPPVLNALKVYCDMDSDGGGWTLFHRRRDHTLEFETRNWEDYKRGFQNNDYENYWMGLDRLHAMTLKDHIVDLRVDIKGDRRPNSDCRDCCWSLTAPFTVGNELTYYELNIHESASNSPIPLFASHNKMKFSTVDRDNDAAEGNCANAHHSGGWWFNSCFDINLNGRYAPAGVSCLGVNESEHSYCWRYSNAAGWEDPNSARHPVMSEMKLRKRVITF